MKQTADKIAKIDVTLRLPIKAVEYAKETAKKEFTGLSYIALLEHFVEAGIYEDLLREYNAQQAKKKLTEMYF